MTRYYHSSKSPCRNFPVSINIRLKTIPLLLFSLVAFYLTSCEEGPTEIGAEILPGNDYVDIKSIDTLSVFSYTMYDDSVRTDNPSVSYAGQIYDPYFGTTTADFITQIRLGSEWSGGSYTIDSVRLYLKLLDVKKGDSDVPQTLRISEIAEVISTDAEYYSNRDIALTGYSLEDVAIPTLKADTVNDIIIPLPVSFAEYLMRDTSMFFYSNTKPDFRSYFKGLLFQLNPSSNPAMISLSLSPPTTLGNYSNVITVFMHDADGNSFAYYFILDAQNRNASFNRYRHDYTTAILGDKMAHRNTTYKDTLSYLQYLNGVYTKISMPGLRDLKNDPSFGRFAINKARIIVPAYVDGNLYTPSTIPSLLYLRYKTAAGTKYVVPDYSVDTYHAFFDGTLDSTALTYTFNIPSYVQNYLEDKEGKLEPELEIFQGTGTKNLILRANHNSKPVKFQFTYTRF